MYAPPKRRQNFTRRGVELAPIVTLALATVASLSLVVVGPDAKAMLLAGIAFATLAPILVRFSRGELDPFEPIVIASIALAVMFLVRPMLVLATGNTTHIGYEFSPEIESALLVAFLGCLSFDVGYLVLGGAWIKRPRVTAREAAIDWRRATVVAAVFWCIGIVLYAAFIASAGGFDFVASLLAGRDISQDAVYRSGTAYLYQGLLLSVPSALVWLAAGLQRQRLLIVFAFFMLLPLVTLATATGVRSTLLVLAGAFVIFWYFHRARRPSLAALVLMAYFSISIGGFFVSARNVENRLDSRMVLLGQALLDPLGQAQVVFLGADVEMFDTLANELSVVPNDLPFQPGATIADVLLRAVPRTLWPDKPLESNDLLISTLWPAHYATSRAAPASSLIGSLYQDVGLVTVIVGMAALGMLCAVAWRAVQSGSDASRRQLEYAVLLPLLVVLLRGTLAATLALALYVYVPLWLTLRLAKTQLRS